MSTFSIVNSIIQLLPTGISPKLGLVLGSGFSGLMDSVTEPVVFSYESLPGFALCTTEGHPGNLCLGKIRGVEVACLQGRPHRYEGVPAQAFQVPIRLLKRLGCKVVLMINAAGSLNPDVKPGQLMLIKDHINCLSSNPLVGKNETVWGPRFVSMELAYDPELREQLHILSKQCSISLAEGVYVATLGPSFETPAEIAAYRLLGADAVGMSTVPEVIVARHCGLRVAVISAITNMGAGMSNLKLTHDVTLSGAAMAFDDLSRLVLNFVEQFN